MVTAWVLFRSLAFFPNSYSNNTMSNCRDLGTRQRHYNRIEQLETQEQLDDQTSLSRLAEPLHLEIKTEA